MHDTRLIERWLPIAALGEESIRERRSMTALPPIYYLHVWWARRPLARGRPCVSVPGDRRERVIGIHGDPCQEDVLPGRRMLLSRSAIVPEFPGLVSEKSERFSMERAVRSRLAWAGPTTLNPVRHRTRDLNQSMELPSRIWSTCSAPSSRAKAACWEPEASGTHDYLSLLDGLVRYRRIGGWQMVWEFGSSRYSAPVPGRAGMRVIVVGRRAVVRTVSRGDGARTLIANA